MSGYTDDAMEMMQEYQKAKGRDPIKFYKKREPMSEKSVIVEAVVTMRLAGEEITNLRAVIDRIGTIFSEEYGSGETEYEDELNHLFEKKTLYVEKSK